MSKIIYQCVACNVRFTSKSGRVLTKCPHCSGEMRAVPEANLLDAGKMFLPQAAQVAEPPNRDEAERVVVEKLSEMDSAVLEGFMAGFTNGFGKGYSEGFRNGYDTMLSEAADLDAEETIQVNG